MFWKFLLSMKNFGHYKILTIGLEQFLLQVHLLKFVSWNVLVCDIFYITLICELLSFLACYTLSCEVEILAVWRQHLGTQGIWISQIHWAPFMYIISHDHQVIGWAFFMQRLLFDIAIATAWKMYMLCGRFHFGTHPKTQFQSTLPVKEIFNWKYQHIGILYCLIVEWKWKVPSIYLFILKSYFWLLKINIKECTLHNCGLKRKIHALQVQIF